MRKDFWKKNKTDVVELDNKKNVVANVIDTGKGSKNYVIIAVIAAVAVLLVSAFLFSLLNNRTMSVVATVNDITISGKHVEGENCFVTFHVGGSGLIPVGLNAEGITVKMERELYDAIVINASYEMASVLFRIPNSVARKVGYVEEQGNIQVLWTEDILQNYAFIRTIVWSVN